MVGFWPLMESGEVKRAGRGRPKLRPKRICADKGYAKGVLRRYLRRLGMQERDSREDPTSTAAVRSIGRSSAPATSSSG